MHKCSRHCPTLHAPGPGCQLSCSRLIPITSSLALSSAAASSVISRTDQAGKAVPIGMAIVQVYRRKSSKSGRLRFDQVSAPVGFVNAEHTEKMQTTYISAYLFILFSLRSNRVRAFSAKSLSGRKGIAVNQKSALEPAKCLNVYISARPRRLRIATTFLRVYPCRKSIPSQFGALPSERALRELVNNSSTKIGCFGAVFRVSPTVDLILRQFVLHIVTIYGAAGLSGPFLIGMMLRTGNALKGMYAGDIPGSVMEAGLVTPGDYRFPTMQADNLIDTD